MVSIDYDAEDLEAAEEHSLDRYEGEETVEGTVEDMLIHLDGQQ